MRRMRVRDERGGVAVWVAMSMIPILVVLALVYDVGLLFWEKGQLQNGADAAALAVAQECATSPSTCAGAAASLAAGMADVNANDDRAAAAIQSLQVNASSGTVTVQSSTRNDSGTALQHPFLSLLGPSSTTVDASATAVWGTPIAGSTFPLAIAECEFDDLPPQPADVENPVVSELLINNGNTSEPCANGYPGGFGWLDADDCVAQISAGGLAPGTPGIQPNVNKTGCTAQDFQDILCETHLIPLYSSTTANGSNGVYTISKFAAFVVTAVKTGGAGSAIYCDEYPNLPEFTAGGNAKGIQGFFVEYVDLGEEFELGNGSDAGLMIVRLSN
jgi:Flp pilus assembly protein TadG